MSSDKPTQTEARLRSIDLIGLLLLALPPLFWAGNFIAGRAMQGTVPPMALSFWRWVIALIVLLPFGLAAMRRDLAKYWAYRWRIIAISITGVFAFNSLVYAGLQTTTASNGLLLNSFIPILVFIDIFVSACANISSRNLSSSGVCSRNPAPFPFEATVPDGHPRFRLTSPYPYSSFR